MSLSVAELHTVLHDLFNDTARRLAKDTGFCQRQRALTGPVFAKSLVFCLLAKPNSTLEDLADFAAQHLDTFVTPKAFEERFNESAACFLLQLFEETFQRCFSAHPAVLPLLRRFNGVYVRDATLISLPACLAGLFPGRVGRDGLPTAALKLVWELEVSTGQFTDASVLPALDNEKTAEVSDKPLPAGSLLLEDMGFLSGERLQRYVEQGVYVLTRVPSWTAFFSKHKGSKSYKRLNLAGWLRRAKSDCVERQVYVFHRQKMALRLLAVRVPEAVALARREEVRRDAAKRKRPVSQKKLELCAWNILLTNAPGKLLRAYNAWEVRRVRWQIELVFKLFKSEGGLEQTQARNRWRVLAELFAKLLAMMVQQWLLLSAGYVMLVHSARRASRRVRQRCGGLLRALGSAAELGRQIDGLSREMRRCSIKKRHKQPSTFDRLAALDAEFRQLDLAA
jgi:Transposase DDE domain